MTLEEYDKSLRELTNDEFQKFNNDFGGGQKTIEQRVREFVDYPEHERRICHLLGLKTEAEKLIAAALNLTSALRGTECCIHGGLRVCSVTM